MDDGGFNLDDRYPVIHARPVMLDDWFGAPFQLLGCPMSIDDNCGQNPEELQENMRRSWYFRQRQPPVSNSKCPETDSNMIDFFS